LVPALEFRKKLGKVIGAKKRESEAVRKRASVMVKMKFTDLLWD